MIPELVITISGIRSQPVFHPNGKDAADNQHRFRGSQSDIQQVIGASGVTQKRPMRVT